MTFQELKKYRHYIVKMDTLTNKQKWWAEHKNDEKIVECMRLSRRNYYYRNRDKEKARSLARYYAIKALTAPPPPPPAENPPA